MTPAEMIAEMRSYSDPHSDPWRWADELERAMREPVAYLSKTLDSHGNMRSRELSWVPIPSTSPLNLDRINHPLFMLPPNAVGIINERLRKALLSVSVHTAHANMAPDQLHVDLLKRISEITRAALAGKEEPKP